MSENALLSALNAVATADDGAPLDVDVGRVLHSLRDGATRVRATRHPLGFVHVDLGALVPALPAGWSYRLHLWPSDRINADDLGQCHDHAWTLKSCVLLGRLADITYIARPASDGSSQALRVTYGAENTFADEGSFEVVETGRREVTAGTVYTLPARVVHSTELIESPTVTLLVTIDDRDTRLGPLVYARARDGIGTAVRTVLEPDELLRAVEDIQEHL